MNNFKEFRLCEIASISAGGDVPKGAFSKEKTSKYDVPIISNGVGDDAIYGYTNLKKISEPCITIAARGTIGYTAFRDSPFYPIIRLICVIPDQKKVIPKYLYYYLSNIRFSGTSAGISQLTVPMVSKYKIKLPDLETQEKIVQILETWSDSIKNFEELFRIEKKYFDAQCRALLSRRYNLTKSYKLSEIYSCKKGSGLSREILTDEGAPCILYGELYTHYDYSIDCVRSKAPTTITGVKSVMDDILIPASTTTSGKDLAIASVIKQPDVLVGGDINIFRIKDANIVDGTFLALYLRYIKWREMASRAQGITIVHLYGKDLLNLEVELPSLNIQKKMVNVIDCQRGKLNVVNDYIVELKQQYKYLLNHLISGDFDLSNIKLEKGKE